MEVHIGVFVRVTTLRTCEEEVEKGGEAGGGVEIQLRRKRPSTAFRARLLLAVAQRGALIGITIEDMFGNEQEKVEGLTAEQNEWRYGVLRDGIERNKI